MVLEDEMGSIFPGGSEFNCYINDTTVEGRAKSVPQACDHVLSATFKHLNKTFFFKN